MISKLCLKAEFSYYLYIVPFNWNCWTKRRFAKWSTIHRCNEIKCEYRNEVAVFKIPREKSRLEAKVTPQVSEQKTLARNKLATSS